MNDLGFIPPPPKQGLGAATPVTIVSESEADRKPQYPSLRLNGEQAEMAGLDKCAIGEVYEITIRIKATRLGGDEWEMRGSDKPPAQFDVISAETPTEVGNEEEPALKEDKPEKPTVKPPKSRTLSPRDMKGGKDAYKTADEEE